MGCNWSYVTSCVAYSFNGLNWIDVAPNDANRNFIFDDFQGNDAQSQLNYYLPKSIYNYYGGGRGLVWNGILFVAVGFQDSDTTRTSTIRYSTDLITWTSIPSNGFGFNGLGYGAAAGGAFNGNAVAWQSNCQTDISLPGEDIITSRVQQTYQSTAQIYSLSSLITFNQTLFVDSTRQTAINSLFPTLSTHYMLYVDGAMYTNGAAKLGGSASWTAVSDERVNRTSKMPTFPPAITPSAIFMSTTTNLRMNTSQNTNSPPSHAMASTQKK